MVRLSRILGRRRRERPAAETDAPDTAAGFPTRHPSAWGDELEVDEGAPRRRDGHGMNYLVIDQFGTTGGGQL